MTVVEFCNYLTLNGYQRAVVKRFNMDCNMLIMTGQMTGEDKPQTLEDWLLCFDAWQKTRTYTVH